MVETVVRSIESHSVPFSPSICKGVTVLTEVSGFCCYRIIDSRWGSSWLSCCCPVSWRSCCFGSAGSSPSRAPIVHRSGGYCGGPTHSPSSGPGWNNLLAFAHSHFPDELSDTASASSPKITYRRSRASSPALRPSDPGAPHSHHQGHLYCLPRLGTGLLSWLL